MQRQRPTLRTLKTKATNFVGLFHGDEIVALVKAIPVFSEIASGRPVRALMNLAHHGEGDGRIALIGHLLSTGPAMETVFPIRTGRNPGSKALCSCCINHLLIIDVVGFDGGHDANLVPRRRHDDLGILCP